jgi:hypothetical protein
MNQDPVPILFDCGRTLYRQYIGDHTVGLPSPTRPSPNLVVCSTKGLSLLSREGPPEGRGDWR